MKLHQIQHHSYYQYLLGSAFLVNFTAANKQLPGIKYMFKSFAHVSNS